MSVTNPQQIRTIWDDFANADFAYASHDGTIREYGVAKAEREDQLPIRRQLLESFLDGELDLEEFKSKMAGEAGTHRLWGFSGASGGMFFNLLVSASDPDAEPSLTDVLRDVLIAPGDPESAATKIRRFEEAVKRIRSQAEDTQSAPQTGYIPYFLSYFWQLQDPDTYPIYYRSQRDAFDEMDLWEPSGDLETDYVTFWELNEGIRDILEEHTGDSIHLWQIERMCLFWLHRDKIVDGGSNLNEEHRSILKMWADAARSISRARHFKFEGTYTPEDAQAAAHEFIENPSEETFHSLWDPMHSAQRAGTAKNIYDKWAEENGRSDQELADLIEEIIDADEYDEAWQARLGAEKTIWELFGLLHIHEYPIINGSAERGLAFFGYETPSDYQGAVQEFEAFSDEYVKLVGHVTNETDHEAPLNYEIDQLLNVIDKVGEGDPGAEGHDAAAELYRAVLEAKGDGDGKGGDDFVVDPDNRRPPKAWQVGPDSSLQLWNAWSENGVMSIGWAQLGDFTGQSKQEIADGLGKDTNSNDVTTIRYFANSIIPGDVVIARHGRSEIDGIGVVTGRYYHDPASAAELFTGEYEDYHNLIDIEWVIDFVADYDGPVDRPESLKMFAMSTVRGYSYFEELKSELVEEYPDLSDAFAQLEARQSELSTEYWTSSEAAGEYDGIEEATEDILRRLDSSGGDGNWLGDLILGSVIRDWTEVLRRNDLVAWDIRPVDHPTISQIYQLFQDNESRLEEHADEIGAGWIEPLTNGQLLFVVLLRDLQNQAGVSRLNFNHVKMAQLLDNAPDADDQAVLRPVASRPDDAETIERQLTQAKQLVFHGPPGTGKTYTAQRFARWWLTQQTDEPTEQQLEVVTFHPSFTYENFIEGLTAEEHDGTVEYRVESGVFKRLCNRARREYAEAGEAADPYVLIIDEINRGNLAQIFGETITLLEPDKRLRAANETATTLPHSKERFTVPPNLYVIGTMNTADRSIALVDAALRSRFRFIAFPPEIKLLHEVHGFRGAAAVERAAENSTDPVEQLLALSIKGVSALNEAILDAPDLGKGKQIGHSYLIGVGDGESQDAQLQSIVDAWQFEILPLLEEYYFGQFDRIKQDLFGGAGGRLFHWDTEQIRDFSPEDLAQTLITLTEISAVWAGTSEPSSEANFTYQYLLEHGILEPGDELVFDGDRVPDDATRTFDSAAAFWRCEVTGDAGQQDNVRWKNNDELYSLSGLSQAILEAISEHEGKVSGPQYWCHPQYDDRQLPELRDAHEAGELDVGGLTAQGEAGE